MKYYVVREDELINNGIDISKKSPSLIHYDVQWFLDMAEQMDIQIKDEKHFEKFINDTFANWDFATVHEYLDEVVYDYDRKHLTKTK